MTDALERVLQLVAEGRLSAAEAAPILEALDRSPKAGSRAGATSGAGATAGGPEAPSAPFDRGAGLGAGFGPGPGFAPGPGFGTGSSAGIGSASGDARPARYARIEVRENGRRVVDLRIPISLGRLALARVPGLSREQIAEVEEAVTSGAHGPILDVQDPDGDGVRIVLE